MRRGCRQGGAPVEVSRGFAEDAMGRHIRTVTCHWQGIVVGTSLQEVKIYIWVSRKTTAQQLVNGCMLESRMKSSFQQNDLMTILDGIEDAVVKLDGQAKFAAMNQAAVNIYQRLGLDPQHMKGKSVWEVFPDLKGTVIERELRQVLDEHVQVTYEFYYSRDQHWYETKGYPASPGAILVFRDITAKKAASPAS